MTLSQFLDVAYAMLVEEFRRLGANLTEALENTRQYAAGGHKTKPVAVTAGGRTEIVQQPQSTLTAEELQNEKALAMLEAAMAGVGGVR